MNQGKLEVFKQEMARVNIDVLGISEVKWMGMGKFNSDGHYIYYCGQESLRRNSKALNYTQYRSQQKNPKCSVCLYVLVAQSCLTPCNPMDRGAW